MAKLRRLFKTLSELYSQPQRNEIEQTQTIKLAQLNNAKLKVGALAKGEA
jgi:hypothetical protein